MTAGFLALSRFQSDPEAEPRQPRTCNPGMDPCLMSESLVECTALSLRYPGGVTALDSLTLSIPAGIVGLVGANGAGKSTLIKLILGLLKPSEGRIQVLGRDPLESGPELRQYLGYVPEFDCLPPDRSATDLITHLGKISGLPGAESRERTAELLRQVGLDEERYRPIGGYSTGMKQRVKLAQGLIHDPRLLLLDEPTNGLDPAGRSEMLELIQRVGKEYGISVIVATHLLGEIEQVADHLVVIDGGRLLRAAPLATFTQEEPLLLVEVLGEATPLIALLSSRGLEVREMEGGTLGITLTDPSAFDLIRDGIADLGLGLIRLEQERATLEEIFRR